MPEREEPPPASSTTNTLVDRRRRHPFVLIERIILRAKNLSNNAKLLYLFLADYAGDEGSCFPGQPRLAGDLGVKSVDTVQRTLNELRDVRLINWKQQGLNRPNIYYLLPIEEARLVTLTAKGRTPKAPLRGGPTRSDTAPMRYPDSAPMRGQETALVRYEQDSIEQSSIKQQLEIIQSRSGARSADALDEGSDVVVDGMIQKGANAPRGEPEQGSPHAIAYADAERELIRRGVGALVARQLVQKHPPELIRDKLALFDWLQSHRPQLIERSPGGWLNMAITTDYVPPLEYAQAREKATQRERSRELKAEGDAMALRNEAERLARSPEERASSYLRGKDLIQDALKEPRLVGAEREVLYNKLVTQYTAEQQEWFAQHPEFADLLNSAAGDGAVVKGSEDQPQTGPAEPLEGRKIGRSDRSGTNDRRALQAPILGPSTSRARTLFDLPSAGRSSTKRP